MAAAIDSAHAQVVVNSPGGMSFEMTRMGMVQRGSIEALNAAESASTTEPAPRHLELVKAPSAAPELPLAPVLTPGDRALSPAAHVAAPVVPAALTRHSWIADLKDRRRLLTAEINRLKSLVAERDEIDRLIRAASPRRSKRQKDIA